MADQADIEQALADAATLALYPQGSAAPSVPGPACQIHRGWPSPAMLDAAMGAEHIVVAIVAVEGSLHPSAGFPENWVPGAAIAPSLRAEISAETVGFSGRADVGQIAGILVDGRVNVIRTEASDTPELVAARLGALIRAYRPVQVIGALLGLPGAVQLVARVVADQPAIRELRRQTQSFRVACFCPSPALRDSTAAAVDTALARQRFLPLPDGGAARLLFAGGASLDEGGNAGLFRRDLIYSAEYATTEHAMQAAMLFGTGSIGAAQYTH